MVMTGTTGWDMWTAAERHGDLVVSHHPLPSITGGGLYWPADPAVILLDTSLEEPVRGEVLAHELVHHERGPDGWSVAREEDAVNDEVARRLVPRDELLEHVRGRLALGEGAAPDDVAERFGVSERVATRALRLLYWETDGRIAGLGSE